MPLPEAAREALEDPEERPDLPDLPDLDVAALLARAEVLLASRIPADLPARAPRLTWIQVTSAGVDHLWQPFLDESEVVLTSARGIHAIPMAEFVLSCLLAWAKGWPTLLQQQHQRRWRKVVVEELHGKTLVLLGIGEIGRAVARYAKALGMSVIGVRRRETRDGVPPNLDEVVTAGALRTVLPRADYVVNCLPLTPSTRGLLGTEAFRAMKTSTFFVNVGRGRTVDEAALIQALRGGWIAGAALDVHATEPLPAESPLWDLPNVLLSPHSGSVTPVYMERVTNLFCENLHRYLEGRPLLNLVDPAERY